MKLIFTLTIILLSSFLSNAQNIKGIWRGTFEQNNLDPLLGKYSHDSYKYEVQINDKGVGGLEGVTYSYLTTIFYGKAALKGIFNKKTKTLTIKETILLEVKSEGRNESCLMTCYLDYKKNGKTETLIGTFSSIKLKGKGDCGGGTVYLEKVEESDFEKEDFLKGITSLKKTNEPRKIPSGKNFENERIEANKINSNINKNTTKSIIPAGLQKKNIQNSSTTKLTIPKPFVKAKTPTKLVSKILTESIANKPKSTKIKKQNSVDQKENIKTFDSVAAQKIEPIKPIIETPIHTKKIAEPLAVVLKERENKLTGKLFVDSKEISIEFYDNGEVDNDTISVYKDNKVIIQNARLSTNPIVLNLKFDENNSFYELICVAENLGDIPPNTALMVINYGRKRQEIFLTSDERKNAKVIIEYKGK